MRVVAGIAGGLALRVPKSVARPTMDKVRGAIFSSLGDAVPGSRVLDLFAGSGGLGIEALSRGAASAVFVDNHSEAVASIQGNLRTTGLRGAALKSDVFGFLRGATEASYDLIFADPPYKKRPADTDFASPLLASEELTRALAPGGTLVLETAVGFPIAAAAVPRWTVLRSRKYGDTIVHFLTHASA